MFDLSQLRSLGENSHPDCGIRALTTSPLILIKKVGRNTKITYAKNVTDKDRIVSEFDEKKDILLFPWAGQYSTDVFNVTKSDLDKYYRPRP